MFSLSNIHHLLSGIEHRACAVHLDRLKIIYAAMDRKYEAAAGHYGFRCTGCNDNCCYTRFYHHTLLEYLYILKGFRTLDNEKQLAIKQMTQDVCRKTDQADEKGLPVRLMCPLNLDGLCLLYEYRPMICRLHGIPHELQIPGSGYTYKPGCDAFSEQCLQQDYIKFDRTPFYIDMAALEKELRQTVNITQKVKYSVAQLFIL
jgi:Fe-S-cluster containining protein